MDSIVNHDAMFYKNEYNQGFTPRISNTDARMGALKPFAQFIFCVQSLSHHGKQSAENWLLQAPWWLSPHPSQSLGKSLTLYQQEVPPFAQR